MSIETFKNDNLFRLKGSSNGQMLLFDLPSGEISVGSTAENDINLAFAGVSRRHARIQIDSRGLWVEDLRSTNGTFIDEIRVERAVASEGSKIAFGPVELIVESLDEGAKLAIQFEQATVSDLGATAGFEQVDTEPFPGDRPDAPNGSPKGELERRLRFPEGYVVGTSDEMERLYRQMAEVCRLRQPVLLHGETGAGKEMLARTLHNSSSAPESPYVVVNCAAIPENLLEAEMFGVVKGAATGVEARKGYFSQAEGGTILLDEIGELAPTLQAKLLRVLQEGEIQPVGGVSRPINVWIIASTHVDLDSESLRRDLYYRMAAGLLEVPPLRRCRADIPHLIRHHLQLAAERVGFDLRGITARALKELRNHPWPGNIRELANVAGRLVAHRPVGGIIDIDILSQALRRAETPEKPEEPEESPLTASSLELRPKIDAMERRMVREAMIRTSGHQIRAAELLGISRSGLAKKLKRLGLSDSWARAQS